MFSLVWSLNRGTVSKQRDCSCHSSSIKWTVHVAEIGMAITACPQISNSSKMLCTTHFSLYHLLDFIVHSRDFLLSEVLPGTEVVFRINVWEQWHTASACRSGWWSLRWVSRFEVLPPLAGTAFLHVLRIGLCSSAKTIPCLLAFSPT